MRDIDLTNVQEATEFENLVPGGYIAKITVVHDMEEKEYLKIEYDIAEGKYKGYYGELFDRANFWGGNFIRSYKEKALSFFKAFTTSVEGSNNGFKWTSDETKLVGKFVGLVLGEEEYIGKEGTAKKRLYVSQTRSIDEIKKGNFKVPEPKILPKSEVPSGFVEVTEDLSDLPF